VVSAIIINYNGGDDLLRCLESCASQREVSEIIVVDNASGDGSVERASRNEASEARLSRDSGGRQSRPVTSRNEASEARLSRDSGGRRSPPVTDRVRFLRNADNRGFANAANQGAALATGDVVLFLNPDVRLEPGCVRELAASLAERPGVAGPATLLEATGELHAGETLNHLGFPRTLAAGERGPLWVQGCALATTRSTFERLGGFDERYFMFIEDMDYCWRVLLAGEDVAVPSSARAVHAGGGSAPGGYAREGAMHTSSLRLVSRHRYTLAMLLKCAPAVWLPLIVPMHVVKTLATAVAALALRRPRIARELVATIGWNAGQLPESLRRRRAIPRVRSGRKTARERVGFGCYELAFLRRGVPSVD
jgi:GT2 family glycosyltransferase